MAFRGHLEPKGVSGKGNFCKPAVNKGRRASLSPQKQTTLTRDMHAPSGASCCPQGLPPCWLPFILPWETRPHILARMVFDNPQDTESIASQPRQTELPAASILVFSFVTYMNHAPSASQPRQASRDRRAHGGDTYFRTRQTIVTLCTVGAARYLELSEEVGRF